MWPKFATSTYFLMTALSLVDFVPALPCEHGAVPLR